MSKYGIVGKAEVRVAIYRDGRGSEMVSLPTNALVAIVRALIGNASANSVRLVFEAAQAEQKRRADNDAKSQAGALVARARKAERQKRYAEMMVEAARRATERRRAWLDSKEGPRTSWADGMTEGPEQEDPTAAAYAFAFGI
jgi:hypothetical protein